MFDDVTGIILTGGESKRMGKDKASLELSGRPLVERTVGLFKRLFGDTIIVAKKAGRLGDLGCREVEDMLPESGAMVGILTALKEAKTGYIFTAACDMPFLNEKVIALIVEEGQNFDVTIPEWGGKIHPMHAMYSKDCYKGMLRFMRESGKSISRFISNLPTEKVRIIGEEELKAVDPEGRSLFNMNTPEELKMAEALISKEPL